MTYKHSNAYPHPAPPSQQRARVDPLRRADLALNESERVRREQDRKDLRRRSSTNLLASTATTDSSRKSSLASPQLARARSNPLLVEMAKGPHHRTLISTRSRTRSQQALDNSKPLTFLPVPPTEPASKFSNSTSRSAAATLRTVESKKKGLGTSIGHLLKTPSRLNLRKKASRADVIRVEEQRFSASSTADSSRVEVLSDSVASSSNGASFTSTKSRRWADRLKNVFKSASKSSRATFSSAAVVQDVEPEPVDRSDYQDEIRFSAESGRFSDAPCEDLRRSLHRAHERPMSISSLLSSTPADQVRSSRELIPSPSAHSPQRDTRGLPIRTSSVAAAKVIPSPKKAAMGPEQLISVMAADDDAPTAVQQVCGATTALADLLVGFEDTANLTSALSEATGVPVVAYPKLQVSYDSLRSTVSDVPEDLKLLLARQQTTDDTTAHLEQPSFLSGATGATDATYTSFEGKATTAASALRHLLIEKHFRSDVQGSVEDPAHSPCRSIPESVQDYLQMARPSVGDRMFESKNDVLPPLVSPTETDRFTLGTVSPSQDSYNPLVRFSSSHRTMPSVSTVFTDEIPQSDLTQLSVTSLSSSPCPKPLTSVPMLTTRQKHHRRAPPPVAPNFRFPAVRKQNSLSKLLTHTRQPLHNKIRQQASLDSLFDARVSYARQPALRRVASRYDVVPEPSATRSVSRSTMHSRQSSFGSNTSASESFTIEEGRQVAFTHIHSRHVSQVSNMVPDTIAEIEEHDSARSVSPSTSQCGFSSSPDLGASLCVSPPSDVEDDLSIQISVSARPLKLDDEVPLDISPYKSFDEPKSQSGLEARRVEPYVFANAAELVHTLYTEADMPMKADAQDWCRFRFAADIELARSRELYPDSPYSQDEVARFDSPVTVREISDFLIDSQERFRSSMDSACCLMPEDLDSSVDLLDHITPIDQAQSKKRTTLYESLLNRSLHQSQSHKSEPSPFTALPPRVNVRAKAALLQAKPKNGLSTTKRTSKQVDLAFLGERVTSRRVEQFDAARRKLEGTGRPDEQRSDGEEDDTSMSFSRTSRFPYAHSSLKLQGEENGVGSNGTTPAFKRPRKVNSDKRRYAMSQQINATLRV